VYPCASRDDEGRKEEEEEEEKGKGWFYARFPESTAESIPTVVYQPQRRCRSASPSSASSLGAARSRTCRQHRESFASCAPTVRKLNERLQLCSRRCNEPRSPSRGCLFYKFIIGVALRRITELPRSLPPSLPLSLSLSLSLSLCFSPFPRFWRPFPARWFISSLAFQMTPLRSRVSASVPAALQIARRLIQELNPRNGAIIEIRPLPPPVPAYLRHDSVRRSITSDYSNGTPTRRSADWIIR